MAIFLNNLTSVIVYAAGTTTPALLTATKFPKDGQSLPTPEGIYDTNSADQRVPTGEKIPISIRIWDVDAAEAAAVKALGRSLSLVDIHIVSGNITVELYDIYPNVLTSALNEAGKHGFAIIEGDAVAYGSNEAQSVAVS
jgi:hypothetical protein